MNVILAMLDSRSISTIWFWILLLTVWNLVTRNVLGVPPLVYRSVPRHDPAAPDSPEALTLLDWLSLTVPRWRIDRVTGLILLGIGCFLGSSLILLGFGYGLEMAQALVFLLAPVVLYYSLGLRLARRLRAILSAAHAHNITPNHAASLAARDMKWHALMMSVAMVLGVVVTTFWGVIRIFLYMYLLF